MQLVITIELDNAAFVENCREEVNTILQGTRVQNTLIEFSELKETTDGKLRDSNGNIVGYITIS